MLAGRRIVITGVGGIGGAVARRARAEGARVHLVDSDAATVTALADALGATGTVADLADGAATDAALAAASEALGGLDGLVAVAGGSGRRFGDGPVEQLVEAAVRDTLDLNALPPVLALAAFVRQVRGAPGPLGAVLVGSVLASHPHPDFATHAYAFAKAGIEGLARAAASRYAADGIQVNVVAPGLVRTPMSKRAQADPGVRALARRKQPLTPDGFVDVDELASACAWLLSTRQVTGQVIAVDGGWGVC